MKLKDLAIQALRWGSRDPLLRFARGYEERGLVTWDAMPPAGVAAALHRYTLLSAIELASQFLGTDYSTEREEIVCGPVSRRYLCVLPQFEPQPVDGLYPYDEKARAIKLGIIHHRRVFYRADMPEATTLVFNSNGRVCRFLMKNAA